jgi:PAS domain S-box-containing protein
MVNTGRAARALELLADLADALCAQTDPIQALATLYPRLSKLLPRCGWCHYVASAGEELSLQIHRGMPDDIVPTISHINRAEVSEASAAARTATARAATTGLARRMGAASCLCVPLGVEGSTVEVLVFALQGRGASTDEELRFLQLLGRQMAWAVRERALTGRLSSEQRMSGESSSAGKDGHGIGLDEAAVTAQRAALDHERRRLHATLDVLPVGVFIADQDGRVTAANSAAATIWGRLPVLSPTLEDFADDYPAFVPGTHKRVPWAEFALARALRGERLTAQEREVERPEGRRSLLVHGVPIRDSSGQLMGAVSVAVDVTDLKRIQRQLMELNEALEQRVRERTRSLVNYQEQLRAMASELILTEQRERRRLAAELHDYLAQLLVASKMRFKMVGTHIDAPEGLAVLAEVRGLMDEALKYTRTLIADLSPTILYEAGLYAAIHWLGDRMQQQGLNVRIQADGESVNMPDDQAVMIYQTVRELLFNVNKHANVAEAIVDLEQSEALELKVTVSDEGTGFDPARMPSDPAGGKFGLFSIRERLAALGGSFEIHSAPGRGTRAVIRVPLPKAESPEPLESPEVSLLEVARANVGRNGRAIRVLLADDHKMVREGFRSLIESDASLEVVGEAANGEEAVELAHALLPDVIVMDINMPRMNGIEATRRIKNEMPHVAIIGLSVHDDRGLTASMLDAGAVSYLTKGGPSEELARAIHSAHAQQVACASPVQPA